MKLEDFYELKIGQLVYLSGRKTPSFRSGFYGRKDKEKKK
jgi:hypothetical protein